MTIVIYRPVSLRATAGASADGRIQLDVPEMLAALRALAGEAAPAEAEAFPFVLIAGERRSYNANQIYRDPAWRRNDADGALHVHPDDALRLGLREGALAFCKSARGRVAVRVALTETLRPGVVSLPHGYGMDYPDAAGERRPAGPALNLLTDAAQRDPITATPYHKHVRVRLRPAV